MVRTAKDAAEYLHVSTENIGCLRDVFFKEDTTEQQAVFGFLNYLRQTGVTNMFSARRYIMFYLDIDREKAREYLDEWLFRTKEKAICELLNIPHPTPDYSWPPK